MMDIGVLPAAAAAQILKAGLGKYIIINTDMVESGQMKKLIINILENTTFD